jgi:hypothetical protein
LAPTVGIAATGFGIRAGSFNFFIDKISKFFIDKIRNFFHRQDHQILRLPTAASGGSINLQQASNSSSSAIFIKIGRI